MEVHLVQEDTHFVDICWKTVYTRKERPGPEVIAAAESMRRQRIDQDEAQQRLAQLLIERCWCQRLEVTHTLRLQT